MKNNKLLVVRYLMIYDTFVKKKQLILLSSVFKTKDTVCGQLYCII